MWWADGWCRFFSGELMCIDAKGFFIVHSNLVVTFVMSCRFGMSIYGRWVLLCLVRKNSFICSTRVFILPPSSLKHGVERFVLFNAHHDQLRELKPWTKAAPNSFSTWLVCKSVKVKHCKTNAEPSLGPDHKGLVPCNTTTWLHKLLHHVLRNHCVCLYYDDVYTVRDTV